MDISDGPVLFFDGVCNLCNSTVQFIIRHDKAGRFRFAALQSEAGADAIAKSSDNGGPSATAEAKLNSVILLYKGKYYTKSSAALKVAGLLGGRMWLLSAGWFLPRFIRDAIYDAVAKRRYRWFGKRNECMIPTPELKGRFL